MKRALLVFLALVLTAAAVADEALNLELADLVNAGRYDETIAKATEYLEAAEEKGEEPDNTVQYLRGHAAYHIAWYGLAESDFAPLGDFSPWDEWEPASHYTELFPVIKRLAPKNVHEIRQRKAVVFRIYYDEADEWTDTVVRTLADAYRAVCEFYGVTLTETVVVIFSDGPRYNEFFQTIHEAEPTAWQWAAGGTGVLYFCGRNAEGEVFPDPTTDYLRSSIAHEFSHCLLHRYLGTTDIPPWLDEGLATWCGALLVPEEMARNDRAIARVVTKEQELSLPELSTWEGFYEQGKERTAYTQAFAMTRYLESEVGRPGLMQLLTLLRDEGDLDKAFEKGWGLTSEQFYRQWLRVSVRMLEDGTLR